jgi:hypothetical protein
VKNIFEKEYLLQIPFFFATKKSPPENHQKQPTIWKGV